MPYQLEDDNSGNASWVGEAVVSKTGCVSAGQLKDPACFKFSLEHRLQDL